MPFLTQSTQFLIDLQSHFHKKQFFKRIEVLQKECSVNRNKFLKMFSLLLFIFIVLT